MSDVYKLKCEEYETVPRPEFAKIFEGVDASNAFSISVQGNSVGMFTKRLDDVEVIAMVQTIMSSGLDNLEHLDLRYHHIGDAGATALSLLFQDAGDYRCILKSLLLQGNSITEVGAAKLAMNLVFNTTIVELNLNGNPLGNEGGMAVAQMLSKNRTLRKLDIGNTELGTESIIALATVLKSNNVLTSLNIENPRLYSKQEESTHQLAKMMQVITIGIRYRHTLYACTAYTILMHFFFPPRALFFLLFSFAFSFFFFFCRLTGRWRRLTWASTRCGTTVS
jgi:Ran GTPase-activating protein (RanGAP) involved in mRNA processing and transport